MSMKEGEVLDGEGGFRGVGQAGAGQCSLKQGYLPLGLAHNVARARHRRGRGVKRADVAYDAGADAVKVPREMEAMFARPNVR